MPNIRRSSPSNLGTNVEVKVLRPSDAKFISAGKVLFFLHKGSILSWQGDLPEIWGMPQSVRAKWYTYLLRHLCFLADICRVSAKSAGDASVQYMNICFHAFASTLNVEMNIMYRDDILSTWHPSYIEGSFLVIPDSSLVRWTRSTGVPFKSPWAWTYAQASRSLGPNWNLLSFPILPGLTLPGLCPAEDVDIPLAASASWL